MPTYLGTLSITEAGEDTAAQRTNKRKREVIFKNCTPSTCYISQIHNTQIDNAEYLDIVMPMNNLIE